MEDVRATLLGTGHAWPLPEPGCLCDQCTLSREDAGKRRTRSGLLIQTGAPRDGASGGADGGTGAGAWPESTVLLDAGPDVWQQFEREGLAPRVDRVVISHHHDDHMLGLRDLCILNRRHARVLPVHCGPVTERRIRATFAGLLRPGREQIAFQPWHVDSVVEVGPVRLEGFETHHREDEPTTAFLISVPRGHGVARIAYATDMGADLPSPRERLADVDLFIGDGTCLGAGDHGHPGTDRMIQIARELGARRIAVTHVGHWGVDCDTARRRLAPDVAICRDGDDLLAHLPEA